MEAPGVFGYPLVVPITSTDVQNLVSAQMGMFGSSTSYASQISTQMGTSHGPALPSFGTAQVSDPRAPMPMGGALGMGMLRGSIGAANVGAGALSVAGMVGMVPRAFDPFRGTLGAIGRGFGGMVPSSGAGLLRGAGFGMAAAGGYMALGSAFNAVSGQLMQGAQEQLAINSMLSMQATRGNLPMMGGISSGQAGGVGSMLRGMASQDPMSNVQELTNLMGSGLQQGNFRGVSNIGQFQAKFRELTSQVRQVAGVLNTSLQEGLAVINQTQGLGFYGTGAAAGAVMGASGIAGSAGMSTGGVFNAMGMGAGAARQMGVHGSVGATMAAGMVGRLSGAMSIGAISEAQVRELAGGAATPDAISQLSGQFTGAALRIGSGRMGTRMLTALVDPETGHIDPSRAAAFGAGALSKRQMDRMYRQGRGSRSVREAVLARRGSLLGELSGAVGGPEQMLGGFAQAEFLNRGLKSGENIGDVTDILLQKYGGLGEQHAGVIRQLMQGGPELKRMMQQRLQQELQTQKQQMQFSQNFSLEAIKRKLVQRYVDPIAGPLREAGASFINMGNEAVEGALGWLLGGDQRLSAPSSVSIGAGPGGVGVGLALGGPSANYAYGGQGMPAGGFTAAGRSFTAGAPASIGGGAGLAADFMGMQGWNPRITGALGAGTLGAMGISRAARGSVSGGFNAMRGMYSGGLRSSFAGAFAGGRGGMKALAGGTLRAAGRLGGGALARTLPFVGAGLLAMDAANYGPGLLRGAGMIPDYGGTIGGDAAETLWAMGQAGYGGGDIGRGSARTWMGHGVAGMGQVGLSGVGGGAGFQGMPVVSKSYMNALRSQTFQASAAPRFFLEEIGAGDAVFNALGGMIDDGFRQQIAAASAGLGGGGTDGVTAAINLLAEKSQGTAAAGMFTEMNMPKALAILGHLGVATAAREKVRDNVLSAAKGNPLTQEGAQKVATSLFKEMMGKGTGDLNSEEKEAQEFLTNMVSDGGGFSKRLAALIREEGESGGVASTVAGAGALGKAYGEMVLADQVPENVQKVFARRFTDVAGRFNPHDRAGAVSLLGRFGMLMNSKMAMAVGSELQSRSAEMRMQAEKMFGKGSTIEGIIGANRARGLRTSQQGFISAYGGIGGALQTDGMEDDHVKAAEFNAATEGLARNFIELDPGERLEALDMLVPEAQAVAARAHQVERALSEHRGVSGLVTAFGGMRGARGIFDKDFVKDLRRTARKQKSLTASQLSEFGSLLEHATEGQISEERKQGIYKGVQDYVGARGKADREDAANALGIALAGIEGAGTLRQGGQSQQGVVVLQQFFEGMNALLPKLQAVLKTGANKAAPR